jgi:uncharacterized Zn finger protein (UPF0148 family)
VRLPFWSRPAPDERQHAIATLKSLGTTSVPGLAAALSWTVPRTEKVLREVLRHGPYGLVYDVRSGTIRWGAAPTRSAPTPTATGSNGGWTASTPRGSNRPALPTISASTTSSYRPTVVPPAPSTTPRFGGDDQPLRECARCHTPLVPTGDVDVFACPMCGRRLTGTGSLVSPSPSRAAMPSGPDTKIQELIAAWATGQPAPCPQCRQPLRHTADGEFRCGSCGARVSYENPSGSAVTAAVAGAPAPGPSH